jgi:hypothetical protein
MYGKMSGPAPARNKRIERAHLEENLTHNVILSAGMCIVISSGSLSSFPKRNITISFHAEAAAGDEGVVTHDEDERDEKRR